MSAVGSAEQALVQIAVDTPRVVVSDVRLPGQDGLALFEEIRRTRPTLPVILLTAHGNIPDAVDATSRGVFGYLTKPFDSQILLEKIDRALQLSEPTLPAGEEGTAVGEGGDAWISNHVRPEQYEDVNVLSAQMQDYFEEKGGTCTIIDENP